MIVSLSQTICHLKLIKHFSKTGAQHRSACKTLFNSAASLSGGGKFILFIVGSEGIFFDSINKTLQNEK
jgi:hypothetical protein